MDFLIAAHSDAGIGSKVNQDSVLIRTARTGLGKVCLCVLCDGVGGLEMGETASAALVRAFHDWFEGQLPELLAGESLEEELRLQWNDMLAEQNRRLAVRAARKRSRMGTTMVACLIAQDRYYVMNVGDSRAYALTDAICQLTRDHTYVQYEVEMGRMTPEEARTHPRRHVLLQCVGASESVRPDYFVGSAAPGMAFLLCSDGFRHVVTPEEIYAELNPQTLPDEEAIMEAVVRLTELAKSRRESDNISAAVIRTI